MRFIALDNGNVLDNVKGYQHTVYKHEVTPTHVILNPGTPDELKIPHGNFDATDCAAKYAAPAPAPAPNQTATTGTRGGQRKPYVRKKPLPPAT